MEWKTAKELAAELGVSSNAIYDAAKRSGCVRGMRITKRGALYSGTPKDGVNDAPRGPKHRIPKPPLTIVEEGQQDIQEDVEALRKEFLDKIDWVDASHRADVKRLSDKMDRLSERLDLWTKRLEDVDKSVCEYIDREITRRFDVDSTESASHIGNDLSEIEERLRRDVVSRLEPILISDLDKLEERITNNIVAPLRLKFEGLRADNFDQISKLSLEMFSGVSKRLDRHIETDHQEVKDRVANLQDRLAEATANGGEYRSQVNERLDLLSKNQNQQYNELRELKRHAQDNVERIVILEKGEMYFKEKIASLTIALPNIESRSAELSLILKERLDGLSARMSEVEDTLKSFNWDGLDGRPKRGEVIGLIRGGVQEELDRVGKSENHQSKAIINDIGRLFMRVADLESVRTVDEEFKRDTTRAILSLESFEQEFARRTIALEKNVRTLLGIDSAKTPSAADIMKRAVKAVDAFADAMKGDA